MIKTVIFDLDGTLLDTLQDLHDAVNYALELHGYPARTLDEIRRFIGNGVKKLMERSLPEGTDAETQKICLDRFRNYYLLHMRDNTCAYEGIIELLTSLKEKGVYIAVVSNKLHSAVVELCEDNFKGIPDAAIGVTVESERKPTPVNLFKAISLSSNSAEETIYVGDSEVDIQAAHNAGLKCICVTWGFRSRSELLSHGANFVADTTDEVLGIILNN